MLRNLRSINYTGTQTGNTVADKYCLVTALHKKLLTDSN